MTRIGIFNPNSRHQRWKRETDEDMTTGPLSTLDRIRVNLRLAHAKINNGQDEYNRMRGMEMRMDEFHALIQFALTDPQHIEVAQ